LKQAATILHVSQSFLRRIMNAGKMDFMLIGCDRRIPRWALKKWQETECSALRNELDTIRKELERAHCEA
jgi:excisionase family DNA binding protein